MNSRSAMASRTSASWQIATIAVPLALASRTMSYHDRPVLRIQRSGWLVQQQDRVAGDEAAGQVDALLLAAGEGGGRDRVQAGRDVELQQQRPGLVAGGGLVDAAGQQDSATTSSAGTRGTTRRNWLT